MNLNTIQNKICLFLIILITLAAVGVRVVGLSYDNLVSYNHDERIHLRTAEEIYSGTFNPRRIWEGKKFLYVFYPWLSMYIVAGVYWFYDLILGVYTFLASWLIYLSGAGGGYLQNYHPPSSRLDHRQALYLGRLTVALFGAATIPLVYQIGRKIRDRRAGLLAAAFIALSGYHVANCHWLKNDIIATFFLVAAFFYTLRIFRRGQILDYVFAGVFSAAAVNAKFYTVPILASVLFAHLATVRSTTVRVLLRRLFAGKLICFVLVFVLVFAATYPLLYLDFDYILSNFREMADKTETDAMFGGLGNKARPRSFFQIRGDNLINFGRFAWEMEAGIGPYVLLLGLGGLAAALLMVSFPLVYLVSAVLVASPGIRYQDVLPLAPFFALLAAYFIRFLFTLVFKKQWPVTVGMVGAATLLLIPYVRMVIRMDYGYWQRSVRYFATRWADRNIPPGSSVIRESKTLSLDGRRYRSARVRALWDRDVDALKKAGADYLVVAQRHEARALEETGLFGPDHPYGKFYLSLPSHYELIKHFDLGVIPYRGGGSKIWRLRTDFPFAPRGINSAFLRRIQNDLSFSSPQILFSGPAGSCEGTTAFIVPPEEEVGRLIISPVPLDRLGVQILNGTNPGEIKFRYGLEKAERDLGSKGRDQIVVEPASGFPFINYSYRVSVASVWNSSCLARLQLDPYRIGLGYFETGKYQEAISFLEQAVRSSPDDWYPRALLAAAFNRSGSPEKAQAHRTALKENFPKYRQAISALADSRLPLNRWEKEFEKWTGVHPAWLARRAGRKWFRGEWNENELCPGMKRIETEVFHLPPETYRVVFRSAPPAESARPGTFTVRLRRGKRVIRQLESSESEALPGITFTAENLDDGYSLLLEGDAESLSAIKEIIVHPASASLRERVEEYLESINDW